MVSLQDCAFLFLVLSVAVAERISRGHPEGGCNPSLCKNGATCKFTGTFYECLCTPPFVGDLCQFWKCLTNDGCFSGGTCVNGRCLCPDGYNGDVCEYKIYRRTWDVAPNEEDMALVGNIGLSWGGADGSNRAGRIASNQNFEIRINDISFLFKGQEFCVRFFYNIPAGTDSELKVYQLRTRIVPNQERLEVGDNFFTKDGEWREARINAHGWDTTDLVIAGRTGPNTPYIAIDQIQVQRSLCKDIQF
ncbi:basement membrane-specific heparan sulfate proteoglycan core protein-like [Crassostrea virginica]